MTLLTDRPDTSSPPRQRNAAQRASSPTASWRFAARLARREVRRRPGRTLLVILLVAVPVLGMTVGSIAARTTNETVSDQYQRRFGTSDFTFPLYPQVTFDESAEPLVLGGASRVETYTFPSGTTAVTSFRVSSQVRGDNAAGEPQTPFVEILDIDPTNQITAGMFNIESGVAPTGNGEVLLGEGLARRFGVSIGDTLRLDRPEMTLTVTGVGSASTWFDGDTMLIPGFDRGLVKQGFAQVNVLVDLPADFEPAAADALADTLRRFELEAQTPSNPLWYQQDTLQTETLAWGWVAGVVSFIAVGIVIAAAFASSARRQLTTIGQLSANGAPQRLVRRTLGLQGAWTAALGAVLGLGIGMIGMLVSKGLLQRVTARPVSHVEISAFDMAVIALTAVIAGTGAALVPARSASKIPVLSALAGRRPVSTPPRWLGPTGIALFTGGLFLLAVAAGDSDGGHLAAMTAVLGALGVLFGMVCSSPLIVAAVGSVGSRLGGIVRLAARSLSRSRTRSAGVMTAIATVSALAIAGLTTAAAARDDAYSNNDQGDRSEVRLNFWQDQYSEAAFTTDGQVDENFDPAPTLPTQLPAEVRAGIERLLPDAAWVPLVRVIDDPVSEREYRVLDPVIVGGPTVATAPVLKRAKLSEAELDRLQSTGVVALAPWISGVVTVAANGGLVEIDVGPSLQSESTGPDGNVEGYGDFWSEDYVGEVLITADYAAARGLETAVSSVIIDNPSDLTKAERDGLDQVRPDWYSDAFVAGASSPGVTVSASPADGQWSVDFIRPTNEVPWALIQALVLAGALLAVLLVVAIGLSLAATESRDERDVLHAIGASPRTLRRVAAAKAWVLTSGAAVVAVPTGYIVVRVVTVTSDWNGPDTSTPFPFVGAVSMLLVIPAIAAGVTLAVSAVAQRARPITISSMSAD